MSELGQKTNNPADFVTNIINMRFPRKVIIN